MGGFVGDNGKTSLSALVHADQPWTDQALARLYDAFPFDADLPLYLELATAQGGCVLELACGSGRLLVPLVRAGNRVVGLDASPHMLEIAREKLADSGPDVERRAELHQGDMRGFDLGETFDLALIAVKSFAFLTERTDQQRALGAIARHLRPGGLLALDLMHPSLDWLSQPDGSVRQDLAQYLPEQDVTVMRTETAVSTDLSAQIRVIRSKYEVIAADGSVSVRIVEWPYRYVYRFEAEHLLERAGFEIEAIYGGYQREPFQSDSRAMVIIARRTGNSE